MMLLRKLALVSCFSLLLLSCGSVGSNNKYEQGKEEVIVKEANTQEETGVSFKNIKNETVLLSELKGKVVFINFWATWCPPCVEEMPSIQTLYNQFKDNKNIVFIMVDVDNNLERAIKFMEKRNFDLPVYVPNSEIPSEYLQGAIPTTVILDKQGNIDVRLEGGRDYASPGMTKALHSLLDE